MRQVISMSNGWIKLHRKIQDSFIWEEKPYDRARAWIDLLLLVMHSDKKIMIDGKVVVVKQGSYMTSILKLADRWGWSKKKTNAFIKMLENESMITTKKSTKGTTVTVVNYGKYQIDGTTEDTTKDTTEGTAQGTTEDTTEGTQNKNYKNVKNDKKKTYTCAFEEFWKAYPRKKDKGNAFKKFNARLNSGFSEVELIEAAKKYANECENNHTEERYIKHASTFLSDSTPFIDYLDKDYRESDCNGRTRGDDPKDKRDAYADEFERLLNE